MKYLLSFFLVIACSIFAFSQNKTTENIEVTYLFKTRGAGSNEYRLDIIPKLSQYYATGKLIAPDISEGTFIDSRNKEKQEKRDLFYKDRTKNQMVYMQHTMGKIAPFHIRERLDLMKWKVSDKENLTLLGMPCKSATTTFRGRNYKAFYTEKIPIPEGPWKFSGLPGLILQIESEDGEYEYKATKITYNQDNICSYEEYNKFKSEQKFIEWNEFKTVYLKITDRFIQKFRENVKKEKSGTRYFRYNLTPEIICTELEIGNGVMASAENKSDNGIRVSSGVVRH